MSDEELKINHGIHYALGLCPPDKAVTVPDYCNDLHACYEAELALVKMDEKFGYSSNTNDYPSYRYASNLGKLTKVRLRKETVVSGHKKPDGSDLLLSTWVHASPFETIKLISASAHHRALALLKTLSS